MSLPISGTMQLCLDSIEQAPGAFARDLPGGTNTVEALMRRGRVEVQGEPWHVFLPAHRHEFRQVLHLDGCHTYQSSYTCTCGVTAGTYGERSIKADPYSSIWMDSPDSCLRCEALLKGARPVHRVLIIRPDDYRVPV